MEKMQLCLALPHIFFSSNLLYLSQHITLPLPESKLHLSNRDMQLLAGGAGNGTFFSWYLKSWHTYFTAAPTHPSTLSEPPAPTHCPSQTWFNVDSWCACKGQTSNKDAERLCTSNTSQTTLSSSLSLQSKSQPHIHFRFLLLHGTSQGREQHRAIHCKKVKNSWPSNMKTEEKKWITFWWAHAELRPSYLFLQLKKVKLIFEKRQLTETCC